MSSTVFKEKASEQEDKYNGILQNKSVAAMTTDDATYRNYNENHIIENNNSYPSTRAKQVFNYNMIYALTTSADNQRTMMSAPNSTSYGGGRVGARSMTTGVDIWKSRHRRPTSKVHTAKDGNTGNSVTNAA